MHNPILDTLASGKPSIGSWLNLASPLAAEVMAAAGFSWLVIDAEHSPYDMDLIAHTFRAVESRGAIPLVRTWDHNPTSIGRFLDAGAYGLVFPHTCTPAQAESCARAMRYPPEGSRSMGTGRCITLGPDYRTQANSQLLCIPQIEDMEGIENVEAIARVEGVDIVFLGPNDLAVTMGVEPGVPEHEEAVQRFKAGCASAGKPFGIPVRDAESARRRIGEGFLFIDLNSDLRLLDATARQALAAVRET